MVHDQEIMLERIDQHAEDAEKNVKKGKRTIMDIYKDVSNNRKLIFHVFCLMIGLSSVYIVFFS